eukprot:COSAG03_NODE_14480_length_462_cov_2.046832_1_plen_63_part_01
MTRVSVRLTPAGRQDFVPQLSVRVSRAVPSAPVYICTCVQTFVLRVPSGALYRVALCTEWRFV